MLAETNLRIYLGALGLGVVGFILGYGFSRLLKLEKPVSRTVALETGIQNTPLTFAIIILSFSQDTQNQVLWLPLIYAPGIVITSSIVTGIYLKLRRD